MDESLEEVGINAPEPPAVPQGALRRTHKKIDPVIYFNGWAYEIKEPHWPAFGIQLREYIQKEKTAALRAEMLEKGVSKTEIGRYKIMYLAYAIGEPRDYDFHEGDLFSRVSDGSFIQVTAVISKQIEAHIGVIGRGDIKRIGYSLASHELEDWLRTGSVPESAKNRSGTE